MQCDTKLYCLIDFRLIWLDHLDVFYARFALTTNVNFFPVFFFIIIYIYFSFGCVISFPTMMIIFSSFFLWRCCFSFKISWIASLWLWRLLIISVKLLMHDNHVTTKKSDKISFEEEKKWKDNEPNEWQQQNRDVSSHFIESTFTLCNFLSHTHTLVFYSNNTEKNTLYRCH